MSSEDSKYQKENQLQKDAFEYYYALGGERTYAKTALKFKKVTQTVERWGKAFGWREKVEKKDALVRARAVEQQTVERELDFRQRNLRIIKRGILEHAKAIQQSQLKPTYKTLIELVREEERIRTGIDSRVEINHRLEIRGLQNPQISAKTQQILEDILSLRKMRTISGEVIDVAAAKKAEALAEQATAPA